jgi:hypothetical protein
MGIKYVKIELFIIEKLTLIGIMRQKWSGSKAEILIRS